MKRIISLILIIPTLLLVGCTKNNLQGQNIKNKDKKIKIYTSIYPLYDFTNKIGGKKVDVVNLVPAGVEPHDWEMSTNDMINLEKADMLIYNGAGIENWTDKVVNNLDNKDIVYVKTNENLDLHKIKNEDALRLCVRRLAESVMQPCSLNRLSKLLYIRDIIRAYIISIAI